MACRPEWREPALAAPEPTAKLLPVADLSGAPDRERELLASVRLGYAVSFSRDLGERNPCVFHIY
jgi:hypothetical protein